MRSFGVSEERLQMQVSTKHSFQLQLFFIQLKQWLELTQDDKVPPSLLLLSRAMFFPEEMPFEDRLRSVLSFLPEVKFKRHFLFN